MRIRRESAGGVLMVLALAAAAPVQAQTCAAPVAWHSLPEGLVQLTGTTCGHESGIVSVCQGAFTQPGAAYVATINVTNEATFSSIVFNAGAGYSLGAYLVPVASGCNADGPCTTTGDGSNPMRHVDIPPGDYFLIISGSDFDSPGACGTFVAAANGFLPVELTQFTID